MDLRPAQPSDLPDIARLHEANWRRDYVDFLPAVALGAALHADMAGVWGVDALNVRRVFVARQGDALLGFAATLGEDPQGGTFLDSMHVAPSARAQGIGRALMSAVAVLAVPGPLSLEVLCANTDARRIYRRWGGQEGAEFDDEILGYIVPAVTVRWDDTVRLVDRLSGCAP
ncbi:GNAT family N-acetyltransferase [Rhodobacteraceae bacterium N5(2021)]|uniref:GNAT family N-acetyltransferase n=1 Tax=Gymnodinialimonas phycosphaerae TaxID=2841589 RepID=A0A975YH62_9RHOB|nr:GNAT family N-acetyltransferase [Gymnodinialimonas phycosphaerae]MBY4892355.1 GNAT family N-acetyltransferase [Gymnodinialimonas phycosphaerae]